MKNKEYFLRGHHLQNFLLYLFGKNQEPLQINYFLRILSGKKNLVLIVDKNDPLCESCDWGDKDYCSDGIYTTSNEIVAKRDIEIARVFNVLVGDKIKIIELIEKLINPSLVYCLGINYDDFFRIKS